MIPVYLGKEASMNSASSQVFWEKRLLEGLDLVGAFSDRVGPRVKTVQDYSEMTFEFLLIEAAMRKAKRVLSFSKRPLVTFRKTSLVMLSMRFTSL